MKKIEITEELKKEYKKFRYTLLEVFEAEEELTIVEKDNAYDKYKVCFKDGKKLKTVKTKLEKNTIKVETYPGIRYAVYARNINYLVLSIALFYAILLFMTVKEAYSSLPEFRNMVEEFYVNNLKIDTPTKPELEGGSEEWAKKRIIRVLKDSKSASGIKYYEYCIREENKTCKWNKTYTKNVEIEKDGEWEVLFRGVSNNKTKGNISEIEKVKIDNEIPIIEKIEIEEKTDRVKIIIEATDRLSGVEKILYKVDDYKEEKGQKEIEIELEGEHKVEIIIEDKAGNRVSVTKIVKTKEESKTEDENKPVENKEENKTPEENKKEEQEIEKEEDKKVPVINLDKVPEKIIVNKDSYELPSYYEFGVTGGEKECRLEDGQVVENTKDIGLGEHKITCEARGNNGYTTKVEKEIRVEIGDLEDFILDGWMKLTLYYPENSIEREYRIADEETVRTGEDAWREYTGPIIVKLSQVDDVYIRYKIGNETYIVSPRGKVVVDIEPGSYYLKENQSTKVVITYDKEAKTKEYRLDKGEWVKYEGPFSVGVHTLIEARAIKEQKIYDNEGEYQYTKKLQGEDAVYIALDKDEITNSYASGGATTGEYSHPGEGTNIENGGGSPYYYEKRPERLAGPRIINELENELVEETTLKIETEYEAEKIYYAYGYGSYKEYSDEIKVKENGLIRAYYVRSSDGKVSNTTYYYVQNIKGENSPYVRIDVEPSNYLNTILDKAKVRISGRDYERLEYSLDGELYYPYENELELGATTTVYARAIDSNNKVAYANTTIMLKKQTAIKDELEVHIEASPSKKETKGLINKVTIKIDYDERATRRYYRIGAYGRLKEYTGEFYLEENETVYAYAVSDTGYGKEELNINYLTLGIAPPKIKLDTQEVTNSVKVSIEYANSAEIKKYKIDNGEWIDYTGSITVYKNCVIYAYNEDGLGNKNESSRTIKNIAYVPNYTLIDKGSYFVLKLNYPSFSSEETREYKWTDKGAWKKYNKDLGILLVKEEYKDIISEDGVKIEDEKGNEIIYKDHYYLVSAVDDSLMDNLYMRWDTGKPAKPIFELSEEKATRELEVAIKYDETSVVKKYKVVDSQGDSGWLDYKGPIKVKEYGTVIYAKGQNEAEAWGELGSIKITNIDEEDPEVMVRGEFVKPRQKIDVQIIGIDNIGIDKVGYKKGETSCDKVTYIENKGTFKVEENGKYTICAKDEVGNTKREIIEITNIDKEAPNVEINILTKTYGTVLEFEVDYKDSKEKKYQIGVCENKKNYTGKVVLNANDILDCANEDKSLTIKAIGIDEAGNERVEEETTYVIDLDAAKPPVINANSGYPVLTEYGFKLDKAATIVYDNRDDITNYYSLDNGETWKIYTGSFEATAGTLLAKSVKKESGLATEGKYTIPGIPNNAIPARAYDGNKQASYEPSTNKQYFVVDKSVWNDELVVLCENSVDKTTITFYDENGGVISSVSTGSGKKREFTTIIPENTKKVSTQKGLRGYPYAIYEIYLKTKPNLTIEKIYPKLTKYDFEKGYNMIDIKYDSTAVQKLYKINEGEWQNYTGKIRLETGDTIYAKSINKYEKESDVISHKSVLPDDVIPARAYDGNRLVSYEPSTNKQYFVVDKSVWNDELVVLCENLVDKTTITFYDENGGVISSVSTGSGNKREFTTIIPENTKKVSTQKGLRGYSYAIYEIYLKTKPNITIEKIYPTLTKNGFEKGYNIVDVKYDFTAVKKLYKINEGEWQNYTDKIRLETGDTIYAKSINKYEKESDVISHKSVLPDDVIPARAYDGNTQVSYEPSTDKQYFVVDKSVWNDELVVLCENSVDKTIITFYDENGGVISSVSTGSGNKREFTTIIPENTKKVSTQKGTRGYTYDIYEIYSRFVSEPVIEKTYPNLAMAKAVAPQLSTESIPPKFEINNLSTGEKLITISYPQDNNINEYSFDGKEWITYIEGILVKENKTIYARVVDDNEKVLSSSSIKVTGIELQEEIKEELQEEIEEINTDEEKTLEKEKKEKNEIVLKKEEEYYFEDVENKKYIINNEEYITTKELEVGDYEVLVYENEELVDVIYLKITEE